MIDDRNPPVRYDPHTGRYFSEQRNKYCTDTPGDRYQVLIRKRQEVFFHHWRSRE